MILLSLACHTLEKPAPADSSAESRVDSADTTADSPPDTTTDSPPDTTTDSPIDSPPDTGVTYPCGDARTVRGRLAGGIASDARVKVAILDAATWRLGDAPDLSQVMRWDGATGAFDLCLDASPAILDLYTKGFAAAWVDLDGDGRYDAATERLCDQGAEGWSPEYLLFRDDGSWSVGLYRAGEGDLSAAFAPILSGEGC